MPGRGWVAWLVSLVAHALLVVALLALRDEPQSGQNVSPAHIEIEINEPRHQPPSAPSPTESPGAHRRSRIDRRADTQPDNGVAAQPEREVDRESEPPLPDSEPGPAPNLSFGALSPEVQGHIVGPSPAVVLRPRVRRFSVDELRANLEGEEDAVANVSAGRADPVLYDYLRGARTRFEQEARRLAEAIALGPSETVAGWGRGYLKGVADAHRKDSAADEGPDLRSDAEKRRPDLAAANEESLGQARGGAEERHVEVCVDVAPGRETEATLRRGSGNAALDRVTLESFTRSAAARPVPSDVRPGRACYEVRITAFRAPPLPFLSCGLDRTGVTCVWPFKRITSVTGRLLSVEYPAENRASAGKSLLRRAR